MYFPDMGRLWCGIKSGRFYLSWAQLALDGPSRFECRRQDFSLGFTLPKFRIRTLEESGEPLTIGLIEAPFWLLVLIGTAILGVLWRREIRSCFSRTNGPHCKTCGYNLTGNESGVCPECATPVPKQGNTA